jgi:hypothetical protein
MLKVVVVFAHLKKTAYICINILTPLPRKNSALRVSFFLFINMESKIYSQPQISVEEQISFLQSEGLSFQSVKRARHLLQNISMFD